MREIPGIACTDCHRMGHCKRDTANHWCNKDKVGAAVAAARHGGAMSAIDAMNHFFLNHEMYVAGSTYWNMVYGQMPGDVLNDEEGLANMKNLGQNMAFLLSALNKKN